MNVKTLLLRYLLTFTLFSYAHLACSAYQKVITVMTYNLENLFDTKHDEGKHDYAYLPLWVKLSNPEIIKKCNEITAGHWRKECLNLDWNEYAYRSKLSQIARVIVEVSPDILVLQEVENINALNDLVNLYLGGHGYQALLLEGPDKRGIDVGIIHKLPLVSAPRLHHVPPLKPNKPTRGILEARFRVGKQQLTIFGNHWPSHYSKTQARVNAAQALYRASYRLTKKNSGLVLSVGDFNVIEKENDPINPIGMITNPELPQSFVDVKTVIKPNFPGTYNYRGTWNFLDRILIKRGTYKSPEEECVYNCVVPLWDSFQIQNFPYLFIEKENGMFVPQRFNKETFEGFSDHLPVVMKFYFYSGINRK